MTWQSAQIPSDEMEDFERECRSCGYDPRTFTVSSRESYDTEVGPIRRLVTLGRNGVLRDVEASSGTNWVETVMTAIKSGVFGKP